MSTRRRWAALAVLVLPVLLISVDMTVLGFAVPALSADLEPSSTQLLWIIDVYSFLLAGLLVLMGNLGDRIGRRRLLMVGAVAFAAASVAAAFATSAEMLIAARALLGLGGATLMPSTLSLIRTVFPEARQRRNAVAVWAAAFAGGAALGPILGGALLEHFWWGSVFLINAPIMVILLIGAVVLLPESRNPTPGPFDLLSAALSIAGMLPVVYAMKSIGTEGFSASAIALLATGVALLWLFARRQRRLPEPLLDITLFADRVFTVAVLTNLLSIFAVLGLLFFLPQYLQLVLGLSPLDAGLWMLPLAVGTIAGSLAAPWLARLYTLRGVISGGMLFAAAGFALGALLINDAGLPALLGWTLVVGLGIGMAESLTNDVVVSSAPPERTGGAASISETAYELGGALGTAVLGTLGLALYRSGLADAPDAVPEGAVRAGQETLGGAEAAAMTLPDEVGQAFVALAHEAFTSGMSMVFWVAAAVSLYTAIQAFVVLRRGQDHGREAGIDPGTPRHGERSNSRVHEVL
ncbi:MAG: MFS transporter [Ornithinimicrobium sp.]